MKKTTKKIGAIVLSTLAIFAIIFTSVVTVNAIATKDYWTSDIKLERFDFSSYEESIRDIDQEDREINDQIIEDFKNAKDISEANQEELNKLNNEIVKYFKEIVGIDVSEKLSKLVVKVVDFELEELTGAAYDGIVYMNKDVLERNSFLYSTNGFMESVYIHEALHYLGFYDRTDNDLGYIYEGLTEAITKEICNYSENLTYLESISYTSNTVVAEAMLKAYPEILSEAITGGEEYSLSEKINSAFDGEDYARDLENLLKLNLYGYGDAEVDFTIQYITYEYVKTANKTAELSIVNNFGIKWLKAK